MVGKEETEVEKSPTAAESLSRGALTMDVCLLLCRYCQEALY